MVTLEQWKLSSNKIHSKKISTNNSGMQLEHTKKSSIDKRTHPPRYPIEHLKTLIIKQLTEHNPVPKITISFSPIKTNTQNIIRIHKNVISNKLM